jgi:hypothetical protein
LEDLGAAEEDGTIVLTVDVQVIFALEELDGLFEKGGGFAWEHGLVDDAGTRNEENVGGDGGFCLLAYCVWRWVKLMGYERGLTDRDYVAG